jgi:peptide/nickel transport system substrate-binding protein
VWAAATASRASHRGGTLRYELAPEAGIFDCVCIDPAEYANSAPLLSLAYDGLLAYRRVAGSGGLTLVADLAESVPQPDDGGLTYNFQLRPGLRFSDGSAVRATDFRASMERLIRLAGELYYGDLTGVSTCTPKRCDLSKGIETDDTARTITIHLRRPDADFLHKLAIPFADVLPARTPLKLLRRNPAPGTGPYMITSSVPRHEVRLQRNPRFHSWSSEARPDGFPDAITVEISLDEVGQVVAVQQDRSDAVVFAGAYSGLTQLSQAHAIAIADASRVHSGLSPQIGYLFLNVHEPPFDDQRVRQALNFAIDRRHAVALAGGSGLAAVSCQTIPPGLPGYSRTCPYTLDPTADRGWTAPDLDRARRLIAASGTRAQLVTVWGPPRFAPVVRYAGQVLRRLGYVVQVRIKPLAAYYPYIHDTRHHAQVGFFNWIVDFPTSSGFFEPWSCTDLVVGSATNVNPSRFCDPALDADATAALAARGADANARWAALDRKLLEPAPLVPLFSRPTLMLVSDRVGNAQLHQTLGPLLDQFWVR